jgi:uncharacterized protein (DUF2132 family)
MGPKLESIHIASIIDRRGINLSNDHPVIQARNPLHGITLEAMVTALAQHYGWQELGHLVPIRCFTFEPSVSSSLKFLRKTPWARDKVESLYLFMLREMKREAKSGV